MKILNLSDFFFFYVNFSKQKKDRSLDLNISNIGVKSRLAPINFCGFKLISIFIYRIYFQLFFGKLLCHSPSIQCTEILPLG